MIPYQQACQPKFKLRDFTSCLCSAAAWAVRFEGSVAGVNATETGNEVSQPTLQLASLVMKHNLAKFTFLPNLIT